MGLVERAHSPEVERGETSHAGKFALQINRQALDDAFAVVRVQLGLGDRPTEIPVKPQQLVIDASGGLELRGANALLQRRKPWQVVGMLESR